ncbi:DUF2087 domain-containing protein [Rhodoplanes sp. TEM]|uniref:DUF2087 domain-containing protein n=1 Tax=Rhodoplanes tepidamans TaxID=200616 RepID=A0ABT5JIV8_RHOTP|nr:MULTISPECIES: DUF2087 domain-containing protein [Rhodoplanes]MDC7789244.1 DUF2087 domain-containing protein [Rhodoplanes tepidamans]MDC7985818.1 DUF2087 domain-containing protein [Rhodoplanes sp. TEM]MDQ0358856.1 hypothetical protein [Rhodoplanes tepidamans]
MPREAIPYVADDMSALARALKGEVSHALAASGGEPPGHVELLNMLARAAGCRNFQHFRAQAEARERLENPALPAASEPPVDFVRVERVARYFDAAGGLTRWPGKHTDRVACLWVMWSRLPARTVLSEPAVNEALKAAHRFGDHVLLRRALVDLGLLARTPDGREYRRVEQPPPAEARALIRHLAARAG